MTKLGPILTVVQVGSTGKILQGNGSLCKTRKQRTENWRKALEDVGSGAQGRCAWEVQWFRRDKPAVLEALRRGQRPLMATTMAAGPLDELVALHIELGIFDALDALPVARERDGIADALLLRTLATLPFLPEAGLDPAAQLLFQ